MVAFTITLLFLSSVSAVSLWSSSTVSATARTLFDKDIRVAELVDDIQMAAYRMQTAEKDYFLRYRELGFEEASNTLVAFVEMQAELIDEILAELSPLVNDEQGQQLIQQITDHNIDFHLYFLETVESTEKRGFGSSGLEGEILVEVQALEALLDGIGNDRLQRDMQAARSNEKDYRLSSDGVFVEDYLASLDRMREDLEKAGLGDDKLTELNTQLDAYRDSFSDYVKLDLVIAENTEFYRSAVNDMTIPLDEILEIAVSNQEAGLANLQTTLSSTTSVIAVISVVAIVLGLITAFVLSSIISKPISGITRLVRNMAAGSLDEKLQITSRDEIGQLSSSMLDMQSRLKTIIKDEIFGIISQAGRGNLSERISEQGKNGFYRELAVSINELLGVNEQFLNETASVVSAMANGNLDCKTSTVFEGKFGAVQSDIQRMRSSFEQVISRDIQNIVNAASQGDLDHSIELEGKVGFYHDLSSAINTLVETNAAIINDTMRVVGALAKGSFKENFTRQYQGSFAELQQYIERLHGNLRQAIETDIQSIVTAASDGDLKQRIPLEHKEGFYLDLSRSINELVNTSDSIISDASRVLGAMAKGDLTETVTRSYKGTFEQLKQDINATVRELITTVENIQRTAASVSTGSDEISSGNANLSQRTEEQAASLEETSAAMEEMTTTVQLTAENSARANQLSRESIATAEHGGQVVNDAIRSMDLIQASSNHIADIVNVIDEIAFQTNLLALNASVEAARAGEQGRGFAVVADEVRVLAGRCSTAAKEVKDLISTSAGNVQRGSELAKKSGEALQDIIVAARKVNSIIGEISVSCEEQSTGIREINTSLEQMDNMTQQNAALVEQAAAASESLNEQAKEMDELVSMFRIHKGHSHHKADSSAEVVSISSHRRAG